MSKEHFKSTRDQSVDGKHVPAGAKVEIEPERVSYLLARGYLVPAEAPKKKKKPAAKTDGAPQAEAATEAPKAD